MVKQADERISKIFKSMLDIPSLPGAVQRLAGLSEKDGSPRDFAEIISSDQGLTARVLRLVNSAFYSLRSPISNLVHASTLLGTKTLKSLALSVSVMNFFSRSSTGFDSIQFWRHSVAVAVASQRLGVRYLPSFEEDLYVSGLLHDVGVALLVQHISNDYPYVLKNASLERRRLSEVEQEAFGTSHAEVGFTLAQKWRFPPIICDCIRLHEAADSARGPMPVERAKATDVVRFCDQWSAHLGLDFLSGPAQGAEGCARPRAPAWIPADQRTVEAIFDGLREEVAARERVFFSQGPQKLVTT